MAGDLSAYYLEQGKIAFEREDFNEATQFLSKAIIECNCDEEQFWCMLAEALFYQAQFDFALQCWFVAAAKNPHNKKTWVRISALYALDQQPDLAIYYYRFSERCPID